MPNEKTHQEMLLEMVADAKAKAVAKEQDGDHLAARVYDEWAKELREDLIVCKVNGQK